ncbi:hypothetical protein CY34DRAFT_812962, partial [Suillus luteus UH-Slu-Lm8-n1]
MQVSKAANYAQEPPTPPVEQCTYPVAKMITSSWTSVPPCNARPRVVKHPTKLAYQTSPSMSLLLEPQY